MEEKWKMKNTIIRLNEKWRFFIIHFHVLFNFTSNYYTSKLKFLNFLSSRWPQVRNILRKLFVVQRKRAFVRVWRGSVDRSQATGDWRWPLGQRCVIRWNWAKLRFWSLQGTQSAITYWKMARIKGNQIKNERCVQCERSASPRPRIAVFLTRPRLRLNE